MPTLLETNLDLRKRLLECQSAYKELESRLARDDRPITPEVWREVTGSDDWNFGEIRKGVDIGYLSAADSLHLIIEEGGEVVDITLPNVRTAHDLRELLRLLGEVVQ